MSFALTPQLKIPNATPHPLVRGVYILRTRLNNRLYLPHQEKSNKTRRRRHRRRAPPPLSAGVSVSQSVPPPVSARLLPTPFVPRVTLGVRLLELGAVRFPAGNVPRSRLASRQRRLHELAHPELRAARRAAAERQIIAHLVPAAKIVALAAVFFSLFLGLSKLFQLARNSTQSDIEENPGPGMSRHPLLAKTARSAATTAISRSEPKLPDAFSLGQQAVTRGGGGSSNGIAKVLEAFGSTVHEDSLFNPAVTSVMSDEALARLICPYALTSEQKDVMARLGLPVSPLASGTTDHPLSQAIEKWILHVLLRAHIRVPFDVMTSKPVKTEHLPLRRQVHNPVLTPRDMARYGQTEYNIRLPDVLTVSAIFFHDSGHYLSPSFVASLFRSYPTLNLVYFVAVLPDEALFKEDSMDPALYELQYCGDRFRYILEGNSVDSYEQPLNTLEWLRTRSIKADGNEHTVELLASVGCHRLFAVSRERAPTKELFRLHRHPRAVFLPSLYSAAFRPRELMVPVRLFRSCVFHGLHLKNYSIDDAAAKARSLMNRSETEWVSELAIVCLAQYLTEYRVLARRVNIPLVHDSLWSLVKTKVRLTVARYRAVALTLSVTTTLGFGYLDITAAMHFLGSVAKEVLVTAGPAGQALLVPLSQILSGVPGALWLCVTQWPAALAALLTRDLGALAAIGAKFSACFQGASIKALFAAVTKAGLIDIGHATLLALGAHPVYYPCVLFFGGLFYWVCRRVLRSVLQVPWLNVNRLVAYLRPEQGYRKHLLRSQRANTIHLAPASDPSTIRVKEGLLSRIARWIFGRRPRFSPITRTQRPSIPYRLETGLDSLSNRVGCKNADHYANFDRRNPTNMRSSALVRYVPRPEPMSYAELERFRHGPVARLLNSLFTEEQEPVNSPVPEPSGIDLSGVRDDVSEPFPDGFNLADLLAELNREKPTISGLELSCADEKPGPSITPPADVTVAAHSLAPALTLSGPHPASTRSPKSAVGSFGKCACANERYSCEDCTRRAEVVAAEKAALRTDLSVTMAERMGRERELDLRPSVLVLPEEPHPKGDRDFESMLCLPKALLDLLIASRNPLLPPGTTPNELVKLLRSYLFEVSVDFERRGGWTDEHLHIWACHFRVRVRVLTNTAEDGLYVARFGTAARIECGFRDDPFIGEIFQIPGHYYNLTDNPGYKEPDWAGAARVVQDYEEARIALLRPPEVAEDRPVSPGIMASRSEPYFPALPDPLARAALSGGDRSRGFFSFPQQPVIQNFEADLANFTMRIGETEVCVQTEGFCDLEPSFKRGAALASDMKHGRLGIYFRNFHPDGANWLKSADDMTENALKSPAKRVVRATYLVGYSGCAKSAPMWAFLKSNPGYLARTKIVTAENLLRDEIIKSLNLKPGHKVKRQVASYERGLVEGGYEILILDECGKLPPGYLEFQLALHPEISHVILLGDPCQPGTGEIGRDCRIASLNSEASFYLPLATHYCLYSFRVCKAVADFWGLFTFNEKQGRLTYTEDKPRGVEHFLFMSNADVTAHKRNWPQHTVMNCAASQGFTFQEAVALQVNYDMIEHGSPALLSMAMARSKTGSLFYGVLSKADRARLRSNPTLSAIINAGKLDYCDVFSDELKGLQILRKPMARGRKTTGTAHPSAHKFMAYGSSATSGGNALTPTATQKRRTRRRAAKLEASGAAPAVYEHAYDTTGLPGAFRTAIRELRSEAPVESKVVESAPFELPPRTNMTTRPLAEILRDDAPNLTHSVREVYLPNFGWTRQFPEDLAKSKGPSAQSSAEIALSKLHAATPTFNKPRNSLERARIPGVSEALLQATGLDSEMLEEAMAEAHSASSNFPNGVSANHFAPKHSRADPTIMPFSAPKRLPTSTPEANLAEYISKQHLAELMFRRFKKGMTLPEKPVPFDRELFASFIQENEFAKLTAKTRSVLMANEYKSDPDWLFDQMSVFIKSQSKFKWKEPDPSLPEGDPEKSGYQTRAKAAQTITQMQDTFILVFGPIIRYLMHHIMAAKPERILILAGKSELQVNDWVKEHCNVSEFIENDYTAYDQSQGGEAVYHEVLLMKHYNIPQHMIDLYVSQKIHARHQFGVSRIMRFSGEPGTYAFNTLFNLSVIFSQYWILDHPICVSGDDSLIYGVPQTRDTWESIQSQLLLKAKTVQTRLGEFCGYYHTRDGIIRIPHIIAAKLQAAIENGKVDNVVLSFARQIKIGASMGDAIREHLPPSALELHFATLHALWDLNSIDVRAILTTGRIDDVVESLGSDYSENVRLISLLPSGLRRSVYKIYRSMPLARLKLSLGPVSAL